MNKSHIRTYTKAMNEAAQFNRNGLEIELSIGCAVMLECGNARRLARETLLTIYNNAGYQCTQPGTLDWRKVNRHVTASIALFDFIGANDVQNCVEGKPVTEWVEAIRPMIAALKVKSVNEVLLACDKVRAPKKPAAQHEGQRVDVGHLHLIIPHNATKDDLIAMATKLMQMAMQDAPVEQPEALEA